MGRVTDNKKDIAHTHTHTHTRAREEVDGEEEGKVGYTQTKGSRQGNAREGKGRWMIGDEGKRRKSGQIR